MDPAAWKPARCDAHAVADQGDVQSCRACLTAAEQRLTPAARDTSRARFAERQLAPEVAGALRELVKSELIAQRPVASVFRLALRALPDDLEPLLARSLVRWHVAGLTKWLEGEARHLVQMAAAEPDEEFGRLREAGYTRIEYTRLPNGRRLTRAWRPWRPAQHHRGRSRCLLRHVAGRRRRVRRRTRHGRRVRRAGARGDSGPGQPGEPPRNRTTVRSAGRRSS